MARAPVACCAWLAPSHTLSGEARRGLACQCCGPLSLDCAIGAAVALTWWRAVLLTPYCAASEAGRAAAMCAPNQI